MRLRLLSLVFVMGCQGSFVVDGRFVRPPPPAEPAAPPPPAAPPSEIAPPTLEETDPPPPPPVASTRKQPPPRHAADHRDKSGGPPSCRPDAGGPFGHASKLCPAGDLCSAFGYCFPKREFPTEQHNLKRGQQCYLDRECISQDCPHDGMTAYGDVGNCS